MKNIIMKICNSFIYCNNNSNTIAKACESQEKHYINVFN